MPEVTDDAILGVAADARHDGQQILLSTHWRMSNITGAIAIDSVEAIDAIVTEMELAGGFMTTVPSVYSIDVVQLNYIFQWITPTRFIRHIRQGVDTEGQVAGDSMPPNVSHVITVRGDVAGPLQRGNKHIGGVPITFSEGGFVSAAGIAAYGPLGSSMETVLNCTQGGITFSMIPIIFHRALPANSVIITNHSLQQTTRMMRRRTVGLGS